MNLIFYQNCISPHQIPYIKQICNDKRVNEVYLIVPRADYDMRREMGWDSESLLKNTRIKIILRPSKEQIYHIQQNYIDNSVHLFSGIRADNYVFNWFKMSLKYNLVRGIISEAPFTYKIPLCLHYIRFLFQDLKYIPFIKYVFAIGDEATQYYLSISKKWRVIPFIYVTESKSPIQINKTTDDNKKTVNYVYIGSISDRKNVISIFRALRLLPNVNLKIDIIGEGNQKSKIQKYCIQKGISHLVNFRGVIPMNEINSLLCNYDILILPSKHDGWGAVINEAITSGLFVICSDKCGAKSLILNEKIGIIAKSTRSKEFFKVIAHSIDNINSIRMNKQYRIAWSQNISGEVIADFFINNIIYNKAIQIPWKND